MVTKPNYYECSDTVKVRSSAMLQISIYTIFSHHKQSETLLYTTDTILVFDGLGLSVELMCIQALSVTCECPVDMLLL